MKYFVVKHCDHRVTYDISARETITRPSFVICGVKKDVFHDFDEAMQALKKLDEYNPGVFYGIAIDGEKLAA